MTEKRKFRNRGSLSMYPSPYCDRYDYLPFAVRVKIAQYREPTFKPSAVQPDDQDVYTKEWWNNLTGDQQGAAFWTAMFPHRTDPAFTSRREVSPINFYAPVEEWNAWSWYEFCPLHLRKRIDDAIAKQPIAEEAKSDTFLYKKVAEIWGDRPVLRHDEDIERIHWLEEWIFEYETQQLIQSVLANAADIQDERRLLNKAMGLDIEAGDLPSQAEGLDDTQAATVRWLQASGEMPLEFLARTYRSENFKIGDRIQAAKTLMDYVHRKVPVKTELETKDVSKPKLDAKVLKGLTEKELDTLEKLLNKLGDGNG